MTAEPCDCGVFYRAPKRKKKLLRIESKLWKTNIPRKVVKLFPIILLWARPASGAPVMDNIGD